MQGIVHFFCFLRLSCAFTVLLHQFTNFSKDAVEEKDEQAEFETGPLSVLMQSVKQNSQVYFVNIVH
jgi:hypothetical protein